MTTRTRGKTNDGPHKTLRRHLLADLARRPGQPCARCGLPMYVTQLLDLDHTDDRTGYLGLSHRACNRRDGQRKTTAILKARGWTPSPRQMVAIRTKRARQPRMATMTPVTMARRRSPRLTLLSLNVTVESHSVTDGLVPLPHPTRTDGRSPSATIATIQS